MSSFYKKPMENTQGKMREFNVGEFEENTPAEFMHASPAGYELSVAEREELQKYRQVSKHTGIGEHAKKRVEILANIGRLTKDVEVEGIIFSLKTLKAKEAKEVMVSLANCISEADAAFELRRQTLARAIYQIDHQDIDLALGGNTLQLKLDLIDDMEDAIVSKLSDEYSALRKVVRDKYNLETEAQVKEVADDIKK